MRNGSMSGKRSGTPRLSLARGSKRMESPAAERIQRDEHRVVKPPEESTTADGRLLAFEQQQSIDHDYLIQLANAGAPSTRPRTGSACAGARSTSSPW